MVHKWQLTDALNNGTDGAYSFQHNFEDVTSYFQQADLAIANLETTYVDQIWDMATIRYLEHQMPLHKLSKMLVLMCFPLPIITVWIKEARD